MRFLRKTDVPWMAKGRWYKLFVESNGSTHKLVKSEIEEATCSGGKIYFPHDLNIVETLFDVHNVEFDSGTASFGHTQTLMSNGSTYITLPTAKAYDYAYIYVWAVRR